MKSTVGFWLSLLSLRCIGAVLRIVSIELNKIYILNSSGKVIPRLTKQ